MYSTSVAKANERIKFKQQQEQQAKIRAVQQCNFLFLFILCFAAAFCGVTAVGYCDFLHRDVTLSSGMDVERACMMNQDADLCLSYTESHGVGLYAWQGTIPENQLACLGYTLFINNRGWVTLPLDFTFKAAFIFAGFANFLGVLAFFTLFFASCCPLDPNRMVGMSIYFFFATLFQGLTLLMFNSNVCETGFFEPFYRGTAISSYMQDATASCSLGRGATLSIAATVLYFVCMLVSPGASPPAPIGGNPYEREAIEWEATEQEATEWEEIEREAFNKRKPETANA